MTNHVHPIGIKRRGPKVADFLRCVGCGLSTLNRTYLACDKSIGLSADEGGRLCFECADKLPVDTEPNCDSWMEALFPSSNCDHCFKKQDKIVLCAICHAKVCHSCSLHESIKAFDLSGKDTAIICLDCCPESILADVNEHKSADFCLLCQSVHVPGLVPACLDVDKVTPLVTKILDIKNNRISVSTNFTGISKIISVDTEPESQAINSSRNSSIIEPNISSIPNEPLASELKSYPPHDPSIPPNKNTNFSINQASNQNSSSTSRRNSHFRNEAREVSALKTPSLMHCNNNKISPQISDFVNTTVQNAVLNMSNIQLKHAAEISALNKKLDGILSELSKMNSQKANSDSTTVTSHNTIHTQVEEDLIAETKEYADIHGVMTMPRMINAMSTAVSTALAAHDKAKNKKKHAHFQGYDYDDEEDSDDSYESHSYHSRPNFRPQNRRYPQNKAQNRANHFQNNGRKNFNNNRNNNNRNNKSNNGNKSNQKN